MIFNLFFISDMLSDDSCLLFLDFYKAFDSVAFPCIIKSLNIFVPNFINAI